MKYMVRCNGKNWMLCNSYAEAVDNIRGLNPPKAHHMFTIIEWG